MIVLENAEEWEDDEKPPQPTAGDKIRIPGSIVSIAERLDDELTRSLQHVDPHTAEYIERLSDEQALYTNIIRGLLYVETLKKDTTLEVPQENLNRLVMRRLEHIYFKVSCPLPSRISLLTSSRQPAQVVTILEENAWKPIPAKLDSEITPRAKSLDTAALVQTLSTYLFKNSLDIIRARAYLCQVYYFALHDQYYKARYASYVPFARDHLQLQHNNPDSLQPHPCPSGIVRIPGEPCLRVTEHTAGDLRQWQTERAASPRCHDPAILPGYLNKNDWNDNGNYLSTCIST